MPNSSQIPQIDRRAPECVALDNRITMTTRLSAAICLMLVMSCVMIWPAAAQDKTYNAPRNNDMRLDWCLTWGTDCGRPAAVAFCNRRRYADVVVFRA